MHLDGTGSGSEVVAVAVGVAQGPGGGQKNKGSKDAGGAAGFVSRRGQERGDHGCSCIARAYACASGPSTGEEVRHTLKQMKPGKATGADGWRPHELAALPVPWAGALAGFLKHWGRRVSWPDVLRQNTIALVPNAGAVPSDCSVMSRVSGWLPASSMSSHGLAHSMGAGTKKLQKWGHARASAWNSRPGAVCTPF